MLDGIIYSMQLNSNDLNQFILDNEIEARILHLETDTLTVADAASALNVRPDQIVKSVLFLADGEPVLAVASGLTRVDYKKLADYLGLSRRRLKLANSEQVLTITGYQVGAVPPFGHRQRLRTVVETAVADQPILYGGGGEIHALMQFTPTELQRIVGHELILMSKDK